jgi:hypothetical protein
MSYIGNTPITQGFTPAVDYFSGNGSTTAFTLSRPVASVAQIEVLVNNVAQNPSTAYTVSSNTLTFTGAPSTGTNNIYVRYTSPISQVIQPGQATVGTTQLVDTSVTAAKLAAGAALANVGAGNVTQTYLGTNVAGNGPAFSVYQTTGTSINTGTESLVTFDTEEFDTNNNFASSRFTPTVAGYYQLNGSVRVDSLNTTSFIYACIYKNGSPYKYGEILVSAPSTYNYQCIVSSLGYANGSTDYYELYLYQSSGVTKTTGTGIQKTYFNGFLARAA